MGDMADFTNEGGLDQACFEDAVMQRGDLEEMYDYGICDEQGGIDMSNPPGLISFGSKFKKHTVSVGGSCPRCGKKLVSRTNKKTQVNFLGCSGFPVCCFSQ